MATRNPDQGTQASRGSQPEPGREMSGQTGGEIGSPVSNEAYNVIAALHEKLDGMEAYRKYSRDGAERIWQELTQHDAQAVRLLCDELERLVRDGRLRPGTPGKTSSH